MADDSDGGSIWDTAGSLGLLDGTKYHILTANPNVFIPKLSSFILF